MQRLSNPFFLTKASTENSNLNHIAVNYKKLHPQIRGFTKGKKKSVFFVPLAFLLSFLLDFESCQRRMLVKFVAAVKNNFILK